MRHHFFEKKEETSLYNPNVSSRDRGETVLFSGSDSRVVCPQEFFAGVEHREFLVYADHLLCGSSLNLPGVECSMEVDTADLLPSGPSVDSPDAKRQMGIKIEKGVSVRAAYKQSNEEGSANRGAPTKGIGGRTSSRGAT